MARQSNFIRAVWSTVALVALLYGNAAEAQVRQRGQRLPSIEVNLEVLNSLRYGAPIANGPYSGGMGGGYPADPYSSPPPPPQQVVPYNAPQAADQGWYGGGAAPQQNQPAPMPPPQQQPPAYNPYGGNNGGGYQDGGPPPEWAQKQMEYARRQMGLQQEQGQISTYQPHDGMDGSSQTQPTRTPKYPKPYPKPAPDAVSQAAANMDKQLSGATTPVPVPAPQPAIPPVVPSMPEPAAVTPPAALPPVPVPAPAPAAPPAIPAPVPSAPSTPEIPPPPAITPPESLVNTPKLPDAPADAMDWLRDNAPKVEGELPLPTPEAKKPETPASPPPVPAPAVPPTPPPAEAPAVPEMPKMPELPSMPAMPEFPKLDDAKAPPPVIPPEAKKEEPPAPPPVLPALEELPSIAPVPEPKKEESSPPPLPAPTPPEIPKAEPMPSLPELPSAIDNTPPQLPSPDAAPEPEEPEEKGGMFPGLTHTFKKLFSAKKDAPVEEKKIEEVAPPVIPEEEPNVPSVDLSAPRPIPPVRAPIQVDNEPRQLIKQEEKPKMPEVKVPKMPPPPPKEVKKPEKPKKAEKPSGTRKLLEQKKEADKPVIAPELPKLPDLPPLPGAGLPPLPKLEAPAKVVPEVKKPEPPKKLEMPKIEAPKFDFPDLAPPKLEAPKLDAPKVEEKKPEEKRPMRHEVIMQPLPTTNKDKKDPIPKEPLPLKMPELPPMPDMPDFPKDMPVLKAPEMKLPAPEKKAEAITKPVTPPPLAMPDFEVIEKNNQPLKEKTESGEKEMALLTAPKVIPADAPKVSGNAVQVVYGRDATTIPESIKASLKGVAGKAKDEKKRVVITAYASGKKEEAKAANMISLSRALALRAFMIDSGISQDRITVKAKGIEAGGGSPDRADVSLD